MIQTIEWGVGVDFSLKSTTGDEEAFLPEQPSFSNLNHRLVDLL